MKILALDLGKSKTVACHFDTDGGAHSFLSMASRPSEIHDAIAEVAPDRVVFEVCTDAGWVADICRALDVEFQAVNPSTLARSYHRRRAKSDRQDALDLAKASAMGSTNPIHVPDRATRSWRETIEQRCAAVERRTERYNQIRAMMQSLSIPMAPCGKAWSAKGIAELRSLRATLESAHDRARLEIHLDALAAADIEVARLEKLLDAIASERAEVALLQTVPGVGPRLAETVVAWIDDPRRFGNARQVGCYAGLTPRPDQSGDMDRTSRISKAGPSRLRSMLVEVAWIMRRYNAWAREVYERVLHGSKSRKKQAIAALARRLLVRLWAMLRDRTTWSPPEAKLAGTAST
ncbi:MAG: IS110 family transposase [Phycisphaerales bacterium]